MVEAFIGLLGKRGDGGYEVNHKNGVKGDNRLENLERVTHAENMAHAGRSGMMARGSGHYASKLSEADVLAIRTSCSRGVTEKKIASAFGIGRGTVNDIKLRKRWAWLEPEENTQGGVT